jgi:hypothetical protein
MSDNELEKQAEKIRKGFVSVTEDEDEVSLSFLDEINALARIVLKDDPIDIYTLLTPAELERWRKAKFKRQIKKIISKFSFQFISYFILLSTITGFLVSEALPFYGEGEITAKTWLQAILTEICFIFLSGYRADSGIQKLFLGVLRSSIFVLMLFVITSEITLKGTRDIDQIDNLADRIARIEKQIDSINKEIDYYKSIDWKWRMTQGIKKRDELEKQVQELKEKQSESGTKEVSKLLQYKIYGKAAFRVILLMISVLITRRLFSF